MKGHKGCSAILETPWLYRACQENESIEQQQAMLSNMQ